MTIRVVSAVPTGVAVTSLGVARGLARVLVGLLALAAPLSAGEFPKPIGLNQKVLVVLLKHQPPHCPGAGACWTAAQLADIKPPRHTAAQYETILNQAVNAYYLQATYGKTSFDFDVLVNPDSSDGWWDAPSSVQQYIAGQNAFVGNPGFVKDAAVKVAAAATDLGPYDRLLVMANVQTRNGQTNSKGVPITYQTPTGPKELTATWVWEDVSDATLTTVVSHELGHQLGLPDLYGHCGPITGYDGNGNPVYGLNDECVGPWDLMAYDWQFTHFGGWSKVDRGWLPALLPYVKTLGPLDASPIDTTIALTRLATVGSNVIRIPLSGSGGPFFGYYIECRQQAGGDENVPIEGVIISFVDEALGTQVTHARVLRKTNGDPQWWSYDLYDGAALQPGEAFFDTQFGLSVFYQEPVENGCSVQVSYSGGKLFPDPAIADSSPYLVVPDAAYDSPDIWIDSAMNGWGNYLDGTPDGDGVPSGPGDPAWADHDNRIGFRVRNLGFATATDITVEVGVAQPADIATVCGDRTNESVQPVGTVTISSLAPGEKYQGYVVWHPTSPLPARIEVRILPLADEISPSNNLAVETVQFSSLSCPQEPCISTSKPDSVLLTNPCRILSSIMAVRPFVPPGWTVRVDPEHALLRFGETRAFRITVTSPAGARPGESARMPISFLEAPPDVFSEGVVASRGGSMFTEFGGLKLLARVTAPSTVSCRAPANPRPTGERLRISGRIDPAHPGEAVALEYRSPSGSPVLRLVRTNPAGRFHDRVTPDRWGPWTVQAFWQGDGDHQAAQSDVCRFDVAARSSRR